jgi:hypothetical protein
VLQQHILLLAWNVWRTSKHMLQSASKIIWRNSPSDNKLDKESCWVGGITFKGGSFHFIKEYLGLGTWCPNLGSRTCSKGATFARDCHGARLH